MYLDDKILFKYDTDEGAGASSDSAEPKGDDDAAGGELSEEELAKLPLHLHPRGKELVIEKNKYREKASQYENLGAPADLAKKLARLEVLEEIVTADEEPKRGPVTQEEASEKQKREWARQQLLDLIPEIGQLVKGMKESKEKELVLDAFKDATEAEAWDTTVELAEELEMEPEALSKLTIPIIGEDKRLLRLFNSGKSEQAVRGAVKKLQGGLGKKAGTDDIKKRAEEIRKAKETSDKLPKTHTPGGKPVAPDAPKGPKTWAEAGVRTSKRLEKAGEIG